MGPILILHWMFRFCLRYASFHILIQPLTTCVYREVSIEQWGPIPFTVGSPWGSSQDKGAVGFGVSHFENWSSFQCFLFVQYSVFCILYSKGLWALEYHIFRIDHLANTYFGFKGAVGLKVSHFHIFWSDHLAHTVCTLRRGDWCGGENLLMGEMPPIYIITSDISNLVLVITWVRHKAKSIGEIMIRNIVTWKTS